MRGLLLLGVVVFYATSFSAEIAKAEFANDFFKTVAENACVNIICSPISAELIVITAALGAGSTTRNQMRSVILRSGNKEVQRIHAFISNLSSYKEVELRMAINFFVAKRYSLRPEFTQKIQKAFNADAEKIDFRRTVHAANRINAWGAAQTNNRIKNLVTPEEIDVDSAVMLVNAIYFKGVWANTFDAINTGLFPFYVHGETIQYIPTMYTTGDYNWGNLPDFDADFVELPYKTHDDAHAVSMYIVRPKKITGLVQLKRNLDKITVDMLRKNSGMETVQIFLPKFKIEGSLDLTDSLSKMGLSEMFSDRENFDGIIENRDLRISKIIQKVFLEVNEKGSEAAVITDEDFATKIGPIQFQVNRPFVSMIVTQSKVTLLSAIINDPRN